MEKPIFNLVAPEKPIEPCDSVHNSKQLEPFKNAKEFVEFAIKFEQENPDAVSLDFDYLFDDNEDICFLNWFILNPNYKEEYAKYLLEMEEYNKKKAEYELAFARHKTDLAIYDASVSASKTDKAKKKLTAYENALNYINTNESVQAETLIKILNSGNK
jgi:hypothetical protein